MSFVISDYLLKRRRTTLNSTSPGVRARHALSTQTIQRAQRNPRTLSPTEIADLQRAIGNRAVASTLRMGAADDVYEREADRVAAHVQASDSTRSPNSPQSSPTNLQRSAVMGAEGGELSEHVESHVRHAKGGGTPMPKGIRTTLESKLGADLSGVKVHTDPAAAKLNAQLGARAFTHGSDIFYGEGQSPHDLALTAHETTHTIQQGAVHQVQAKRVAGEATDTVAKIQRTSAPTLQRWSLSEWRKKRKEKNARVPILQNHDLAEDGYKMGDGGSANRVDSVKYKSGIGNSGVKKGFFKPAIDDGYGGAEAHHRSVASSLVDKWLGTNILAEEVYANHGEGEERGDGSVSAQVEGRPLKEAQFNAPADHDPIMPTLENMARGLTTDDPARFKKVGGQWNTFTGTHYNYHDYRNPTTQKGLSDLQIFDAIVGQSDRHGGNVYVDDKTGNVKGIDQDLSFGKGEKQDVGKAWGKYLGLPSQVDEGTAKKILKKKAKNLPKMLDKKGGNLSPEEIVRAQSRMRAVKAHLKQLKKDKKLVKHWGKGTYESALSEGNHDNNLPRSYLKQAVSLYEGASGTDTAEAPPLSGKNPFYEEMDDGVDDGINWQNNLLLEELENL